MYKIEVSSKEIPKVFYQIGEKFAYDSMIWVVTYLCGTHKYHTVRVTDLDKDC